MTVTFNTVCAQGDVLIRRVDHIPSDARSVNPENGALIVTHSETGHHHVMVLDRETETPAVQMFGDKNNPLIAWLKVNRPTALEHMRPHDTHEPIMFGPGIYEVRRQRESLLINAVGQFVGLRVGVLHHLQLRVHIVHEMQDDRLRPLHPCTAAHGGLCQHAGQPVHSQ